MKKITVLVYEEALLSAVSATLDVLHGTNQFLQGIGQSPVFEPVLAGYKKKDIQLKMPVSFNCQYTLDEITGTDLILIPAFYGEPEEVLGNNPEIIRWTGEMHQRGAEVAAFCYGSYFPAEAGLLSGKPCTSHWMTTDHMQQRYPDVKVMPDAVITDQEGVYTSGGAFLSLKLLVYIIEKFCGKEVSIPISKIFSIDTEGVSQAQFAIFQGHRGHKDEAVLQAQDYIEQNYHQALTAESIAESAHMSRRNLIRRFKAATGFTPLEYLQRVRIEAAKKSLENGNGNISSLVYDTGYNDVKTFRQVFKRITGLTPKEYRGKYSRAYI